MIDHDHTILCVILETHPLCSFSSSYAIEVDLHYTPKGSLQLKYSFGSINLEFWTNHAHNTN